MNSTKNQINCQVGNYNGLAIARALVNDPSVILADEPTGALDSKTSDQVISILKEVSKTRLVNYGYPHNEEIATRFSDRIIKMRDGNIISDSAEEETHEKEVKQEYTIKKTAMSLGTALKSSFKNLLTKKGKNDLNCYCRISRYYWYWSSSSG